MKKICVIVFLLLSVTTVSYAQYDEAATKKMREYMIMDGDNPNFLHAQQQAPNQLTIGLSAPDGKGEGAYELRGDSCIWLVESIFGNDRQLATIIKEDANDNHIFVQGDFLFPENKQVDTIGMYEPFTGIIYNKDEELVAEIKQDEELVAPNGKVYLRFDKADKQLVAFFLLYYYLPRYAPEKLEN